METMMIKTWILTAAMAIGLGLSAEAQPRDGERFDFEAIDLDGNGLITPEELAAQAEARFGRADANGDGLLSMEELAAAMAARREAARDERMARRFEAMDADGDGFLSAEELAPPADRMARMFERADADGDGAISAEEAEEMRPGPRRGRHGERGPRGEGRPRG